MYSITTFTVTLYNTHTENDQPADLRGDKQTNTHTYPVHKSTNNENGQVTTQ